MPAMPILESDDDGLFRVLPGGLTIKRMDRLPIDDIHYGLFKYKFDLVELGRIFNADNLERATTVKEELDTADPETISKYVRKYKSYNQLLMIQDLIKQLRYKDGPHQIRQVDLNIGLAILYEVRLSNEFCERFTVPHTGVVKLEAFSGEENPEEYRGLVYKYDESTRAVQFKLLNRARFTPYQEKRRYTIRFEPSRFVYNARNMILDDVHRFESHTNYLIFPMPFEQRISQTEFLDRRNRMIDTIPFAQRGFNQEQREAIFSIYTGRLAIPIRNVKGCLLPYIIHGPPGTGKTTTLVEAVRLLIAKSDESNRILVSTPSNTAADLFATELLQTAKVKPELIFRMYALMSPVSELKPALSGVTLVTKGSDGFDTFGIPPLEELREKKVIICTMLASTYLTLGWMGQKFSHIIIDEAGQATELDTLVPIVGLLGKDTKIVLAGDARQLGPVDTMDYFRKNSLTHSLIERFEKIEFYEDDPRMMTMLRQNYRSHPAIISVPSELFYKGELVVAENALPRDKLANWNKLPKKGFPILWHHIQSAEFRENRGTSYMNNGELNQIYIYVKNIVAELHVKPMDIGVISPYNYQARKLRQRFYPEFSDITVDTVERFQGGQRRVILVTTVRSNPDDELGFMRDDKRFNTTITRAEELLIIVGNAKIMAQNGSWAALIDQCKKNNAIIGLDLEVIDKKEDGEAGKRRVVDEMTDDSSVEEEESDEEDEKEDIVEASDEDDSDESEDESDEDTTEGEEESKKGEVEEEQGSNIDKTGNEQQNLIDDKLESAENKQKSGENKLESGEDEQESGEDEQDSGEDEQDSSEDEQESVEEEHDSDEEEPDSDGENDVEDDV